MQAGGALNSALFQLMIALERTNVVMALEKLTPSPVNRIAESTSYELVYNARIYAFDRVINQIIEDSLHKRAKIKRLTSNDYSTCAGAMVNLGFTITTRSRPKLNQSLTVIIKRVLELQKHHTAHASPLMQERGILVRSNLKECIYDAIIHIEPLFTQYGLASAVEGSDGIGRKARSPWIRIFSPQLSPGATNGWYLVIHFSSLGDYFYATLGCGSTEGSDLKHRSEKEINRSKAWARECLNARALNTLDFQDQMSLHGNSLSQQYERATLCAKRYSPDDFSEAEFWQDISSLCTLLTCIYDETSQGKSPDSGQILLQQTINATESIINPVKIMKGQGRLQDAADRRAIELHAMMITKSRLSAIGFIEIQDTSTNHSYDFKAYNGHQEWLIEVKGTTSKNATQFLMTSNELKVHKENSGRTGLAIVYDINLDRRGLFPRASGGIIKLLLPWNVEEWSFTPSAYIAQEK